jgi:hypothetical protein
VATLALHSPVLRVEESDYDHYGDCDACTAADAAAQQDDVLQQAQYAVLQPERQWSAAR